MLHYFICSHAGLQPLMKWGKTNGIYLVLFPYYIINTYKLVKMPCSSRVGNCSSNKCKIKTKNLNFYILPSCKSNDVGIACKQLVGDNSILSFSTLNKDVQLLYVKEAYFCSFVTKPNQNQASCMHQIFTPKCI